MDEQDEGRVSRKVKVLIVDDERDFVEFLFLRIQGSGPFAVETAFGGEEGLEKAVSFRPDVILLDLLMPNVDGWEMCRRLRSSPLTRSIPVVVMTAVRPGEAKAKARELGIHSILFKPMDYRNLIELLRNALPEPAGCPGGPLRL